MTAKKKTEVSADPPVSANPPAGADPLERLEQLEDLVKFCLSLIEEVAKEQANRNYSGSHWLEQFRRRILIKEKDLGWGPGPKD